MKPIFVVFLTVLLVLPLQAQDTTWVATPHELVIVGPTLSATPSSQALIELFASHEIDTEEAIRRVVEKGDAAVPALAGLLALSDSGSTISEMEIASFVRNKLLSIESLEQIGSDSAFSVLIQIATTEDDVKIRGLALHKISAQFHNHAKDSQVLPTKAVVGILVANLDDDTYVGAFQKRISQIAQEGLTRWLGLDFGDPMFSDDRVQAGGGSGEASAAEYAAIWWQTNSEQLVWNQETNHFEVE